MAKKKGNRNVKKQRLSYLNKVFKEFEEKGLNWENATEGKSWDTIVSNKRSYERFKYMVKVERERPQIEKEMNVVRKRWEVNKEYKERKSTYNELEKEFTKETAKQLVNNKDTLKKLTEIGVEKAKDLIEEEFRERFEKQDKALFKYHYEEPTVQPILEEIYRLARKDKDSYNNLMRLQEDLYKEVVYQKYEEFHGMYGERYQADEEWFGSVAEEMLRRYRKMMRK